MAGCKAEFDLLLCADTLCYFGDLTGVASVSYDALKSKGWFIFTLEALEADDKHPEVRLNVHGRYSHSEEYVRRILRDVGFLAVDIARETLRLEFDKPVAGLVVTAQKH